jgi:hypothetical protein
MTAIQADEQVREGPYDRPLQTRYSGEMDCKLTIELSVIFGSAFVASHDYNLHLGSESILLRNPRKVSARSHGSA